VQGVFGAGQVVLGALGSTLTVLVLTAYFLADLPRIRQTVYRLVPAGRRPRAILLGDDIATSVSGFVLGNLLTSLIAGVLAFIWMELLGIPYPVLLALFVAIMDLIPVVGSTLAGIAVCLAALTVSLPVTIASVVYIVVYRVAEDYLLVPRIIGHTVRLPAVVTFIAVLVGGVLLGVIGAVVAIPIAAAVRLILVEVVFPRLDRS
jgi:predicted PurR-regulated permease PerM